MTSMGGQRVEHGRAELQALAVINVGVVRDLLPAELVLAATMLPA
jgi:hypothetical protein